MHFAVPKRGFVGPTAAWLRNELASFMADELAPERLRQLGYFNESIVDRLRCEHMNRRQNHEGVLWGLLSFLHWHRVYVEGRPRMEFQRKNALGVAPTR
jgi:asparagine synthase (glutamine-hydrolysing)